MSNSVYLSAGVYPKELDYTEYVRTINTINVGMLAVVERGVEGATGANTAIKSWDEFKLYCGGYRADSYGAYAAKHFFDNGGGALYVSRVLKTNVDGTYTASNVRASVNLVDTTPGTPLNALKVEAKSFGSWANSLSVKITPDTRIYDDGFTVDVIMTSNGVATTLEKFNHCTMDSASSDYVVSKVNSNYVTISDLGTENVLSLASQTKTLTAGAEDVASLDDDDYTVALDNLAEAPISILFAPGITTATFLTAALTFCESRKDVIFVGDTPVSTTVANTVSYRSNSGTPFNSSHGALYYPWLGIRDPRNNVKRVIPPSGAVAGVYCRGAVWEAPAGVDLGILKSVEYVERILKQTDRDTLYEAGVNPIASYLDTGAVIWGQKTLLLQNTALDRVNVRRLMSFLEKSIEATSKSIVFKPNIKSTWATLERRVKPFLQRVKDAGGLLDFIFVCDETTNTADVIDQNKMVVKIYLKPVRSAEYVEVQFIMTPTSVSWQEMMAVA